VTRSRYVIFIPSWFIALVLVIILFAGKFRPHKKRKTEEAGTF